jgi:hypothetical protein
MSTAAARTWRTLYELLTGADLTDPRCPLAFTNRQDKSRYLGFTDTLTTPLRAALHDHAAGILGRLGISEPLTWEPPASCCAGITLPGRDPGDIDLDAVTRLVVTGGTPPGTAAAQLGTTISHVRLALEKVLRPSPEWAPSTPPAAWQKWQDRARTLLTREFFNREYLIARKPLRQIEAETGIPSTHLSARARGIPLTSAWQPTPIDPQWLRDQYARRSYSDIAAELDVSVMTVIAAARRHGIASRPKGVHSRPDMITPRPGHTARHPPRRRGQPARLAAASPFQGSHGLPVRQRRSPADRRPPLRTHPPVPAARTRHRRDALPPLQPRAPHAAD